MKITGGIALVLDVVWIVLVSIRFWRTPEIGIP